MYPTLSVKLCVIREGGTFTNRRILKRILYEVDQLDYVISSTLFSCWPILTETENIQEWIKKGVYRSQGTRRILCWLHCDDTILIPTKRPHQHYSVGGLYLQREPSRMNALSFKRNKKEFGVDISAIMTQAWYQLDYLITIIQLVAYNWKENL